MFKRSLSVVIVCSLVFSLTGCKKDDNKDSGPASAVPDIVVVNVPCNQVLALLC